MRSKLLLSCLVLFGSFCFLSSLIYWEVKEQVSLSNPQATPLFEDRHGNFLSEGMGKKGEVFGFWNLPEILPSRIIESLLIIEDKRFYQHTGVDFYALGRALRNNISGAATQGASTIAMQVARMQNPGSRTYWKKLTEMVVAVSLIQRYGHQEVLRQYLRLVPQGNRIHGVAYAARRYFQKPTEDLGWAEASILASLPKAPGRMNLYRDRGRRRAFSRAKRVLRLLLQNGKINEEAYQASLKQINYQQIPLREIRPNHSLHTIFRMQQEWGDKNSENSPVRTTLDNDLQSKLEEVVYDTLRDYRHRMVGNAAMMVVEKKTGKIRGYLGSEYYFDEEYSGSINFARVPRSSGSTLKPFIFALGLESKKFTEASVLSDLPFEMIQRNGHYNIRNYDDKYLGPIIYRKALSNSRNIPAVEVLKAVGLNDVFYRLQQLGLARGKKPAAHYGLGLAIGTLFVTMEDLVRSYGVLANDGMEFKLQWFENAPPIENPRRLLSEKSSRQVMRFLSDPLARLPSFPRKSALEYPFPVAVKTGTSKGYRDAWTVAVSSKYIVAAWLGHPDYQEMKAVSGLDAAAMVRKVMFSLHPEESRGLHESPFPLPAGCQWIRICPLSGKRAVPACSETALECMSPGTEPVLYSRVHQALAIDKRTGERANELTPADQVEIRPVIVLPPQFAAWGAKKGFSKPQKNKQKNPELQSKMNIKFPLDGSSYLIDPETPLSMQTVSFKAIVTPPVSQVDWYVDGKLFQSSAYPYVIRWPLQAGKHTIQTRFPHADVSSQLVSITVR